MSHTPPVQQDRRFISSVSLPPPPPPPPAAGAGAADPNLAGSPSYPDHP